MAVFVFSFGPDQHEAQGPAVPRFLSATLLPVLFLGSVIKTE